MLDVPAVEHPVGLSRGPEVVRAMRELLADGYRRHGVTGEPRSVALDVTPPSLAVGPEYGLPMRYVPYNGGGVVEDPGGRRSRPRIAVSVSSSLPGQAGIDALVPIVAAARDVDAEFVLAVGDADPGALGDLPDNVRTFGYRPLTILLAGCDAAIHQGGSGSTLAALDAGVPQLILPYLGDSFINGQAVHKRGCGLVVEDGAPDAETIAALLAPTLVETAREVAAEMAGMPAPAELVPRLLALT
jgi:UDP:flavonoid glycosyltransferase YjiC (YdhE family)